MRRRRRANGLLSLAPSWVSYGRLGRGSPHVRAASCGPPHAPSVLPRPHTRCRPSRSKAFTRARANIVNVRRDRLYQHAADGPDPPPTWQPAAHLGARCEPLQVLCPSPKSAAVSRIIQAPSASAERKHATRTHSTTPRWPRRVRYGVQTCRIRSRTSPHSQLKPARAAPYAPLVTAPFLPYSRQLVARSPSPLLQHLLPGRRPSIPAPAAVPPSRVPLLASPRGPRPRALASSSLGRASPSLDLPRIFQGRPRTQEPNAGSTNHVDHEPAKLRRAPAALLLSPAVVLCGAASIRAAARAESARRPPVGQLREASAQREPEALCAR